MKRSCEVNFSGTSVAQNVKGNKNKSDSGWGGVAVLKIDVWCFILSPCGFTALSSWHFYHLMGKLPHQTSTNKATKTADHLHYFV